MHANRFYVYKHQYDRFFVYMYTHTYVDIYRERYVYIVCGEVWHLIWGFKICGFIGLAGARAWKGKWALNGL